MILTKARLIAQERYDLEDFLADQNGIKTDSKFWTKRFISDQNYILRGFNVSGLGLKIATVAMTNSTLIHGENTFDFSWFTAEDAPTDIIVPDADLQDGVKSYLELRLVEETTTPLTKAFWDKAANSGNGSEFNQETDTIVDLAMEVVTLTGGFSGNADRIKLAIVETDGTGTIVGITDKRDLLYRLGNEANPDAEFTWISKEEPNISLVLTGVTGTFEVDEAITFSGGAVATCTLGGTTSIKMALPDSDSFASLNTLIGGTSGATATLSTYIEDFVGGDKDIFDQRKAYEATTTEIKKLKGTRFWYQTADSDVNTLFSISNQDRSITLLDEGAKWNWTLGTDTLAWDASLFIRIPGLANNVNEISTSSTVLDADGKAAYVTLKRTAGASTLAISVADISLITPTEDLFIIAQRVGTEIIITSKSYALVDTATWKIKEKLNIIDTTSSTDKDTGALVVEGGVGIEENLNIGGDQTIAGTTSSTDKDTGALVVEGGVGVEENLNVGGDVVITGNLQVDGVSTTLNTQTLDVEDSNITVNKNGNQSAANTNDAGLKVEMSDATDAQLHYDSTITSKFKAGEVGSEEEILTTNHVQTVTNKTLTAPILEGATQLNDPIEEEIITDSTTTGAVATIATLPSPIIRLSNVSLTSVAALATPVSGKVITLMNVTGSPIQVENDNGATAAQGIITGIGATITLADDASLILKYDDTDSRWRIIGGTGAGGGGAGGINYIDNSTFDADISGVNTYDDGAVAIPVDGTGGSPTVITVTQETVAPLRGLGSLKISKSAADGQGEGASIDFTIDLTDQAQKLIGSFDFSDTVNFADDDIQIFIYDKTNAKIIRVNGETIKAGTKVHYFQFQAPPDSVEFRAIAHIASTNALAYDVLIDNFKVGPQVISHGAIITDWESFTPTGTWVSGNEAYTGVKRRVGDTAEYRIDVDITGAVTAAVLNVTIPETIDTAKLLNTQTQNILGTVSIRDASGGSTSSTIIGVVRYVSGSIVGVRYLDDNTTLESTTDVDENSPIVFASGDRVTLTFSIPIQGWSSNAKMSEDFSGREIIAEGAGNGGGTLTASVTNIDFTETKDTTASFDGSIFIAPETGDYIITGSIRTTTGIAGATISAYIDPATGSYAASKTLGYAVSNPQFMPFSGTIHLVKGYKLVIRASRAFILQDVDNNHWIHIQKLASPQTMLENETVAARYTSSDGQVFSNGTTLEFEELGFDTHNAYNTSNGDYTVPVSGYYQVNCHVETDTEAWTLNQGAGLRIQLDGANAAERIIRFSGGSQGAAVVISDIIEATKGQVIRISAVTNITSNLVSTSARNTISIARLK